MRIDILQAILSRFPHFKWKKKCVHQAGQFSSCSSSSWPYTFLTVTVWADDCAAAMTLAGEVSLRRQRLAGGDHCKEPLLIHPASCGQPSRNSCIMHLHPPWTMLLESTEASRCYLFALNRVILSKAPGCCILPHPGFSVNHLCTQSIRQVNHKQPPQETQAAEIISKPHFPPRGSGKQ